MSRVGMVLTRGLKKRLKSRRFDAPRHVACLAGVERLADKVYRSIVGNYP